MSQAVRVSLTQELPAAGFGKRKAEGGEVTLSVLFKFPKHMQVVLLL